jgi:hypothetical protein
MFENFDKNLKIVFTRIKRTIEILKLHKVKSSVENLYSKINKNLRTDIDKLYLTIQQCYDECLFYLESNNIDIHNISSIPKEHRKFVKDAISPFWKSFQHSITRFLQQNSKYLLNLDKDLLEELQAASKMTTEDILNIFDDMLKSVSNEVDYE